MKNKNDCFILQRKMQRLIFIILLMIPLGVFSLCQKKWQRTPSGIYYRIYTSDTAKPKPVHGDHIWMHLRKFSPKQKEIFNTRVFDTKNGVEMDYRKTGKASDVTEIFSLMGKGDSAIVKIPSSLLDSNGKAKKYYTFWLNLIDFKRKAVYDLDKKEQYKKQIMLDSLTVADYLTNANLLDALTDTFGNRYVLKHSGIGNAVMDGDSIRIHYIGRLANGRAFDDSYERNQPLPFVVGKRQVIDGLDKGIRNFHRGDKGILIIPSRSAYGDKEVGKIPPNSVLVFEVEILME